MPDPENMPTMPLTEGQKKLLEMLKGLPEPPMLPEVPCSTEDE